MPGRPILTLNTPSSKCWESRLRRFTEAVGKGQVPDPELLSWIADAFKKILAGEEARRALGVVRTRGRKSNVFDRFVNAVMVESLRNRGSSYGQATEAVRKSRDYFNIRTIEKQYAEFREAAAGFLTEIEEHTEFLKSVFELGPGLAHASTEAETTVSNLLSVLKQIVARKTKSS